MADDELTETIEAIRQQQFPDVPADLVRKIIDIERDYAEYPAEAYKRMTQAIDNSLESANGRDG
jgi:hypothetical protein